MDWYYADQGKEKGPVPDQEWEELVARGVIRGDTLVWRSGMDGWQPWESVRPAAASPAEAPLPDHIVAPLPDLPMPGGTGDAGQADPESGRVVCAECGLRFPPQEVVPFGSHHVCASCKPIFLQRLREGALSELPHGHAEGQVSAKQLLDRDYSVNVGDRLSEAWRLLFKNPSLYLGGGAIAFIVYIGINVASGILSLVPLAGMIVSQLLTSMVSFVLFGGVYLFYAEARRGRPVDVGRIFAGFGPRSVQLLLAGLPLGVILAIAYLPMTVFGATTTFITATGPGGGAPPPPATLLSGFMISFAVMGAFMLVYLYFNLHWIYAPALILEKKLGWKEALTLSYRVAHKHPWQHLWLVFITGLVMTLGVLACGIGLFITFPLALATIALQYDNLFADLDSTNPEADAPSAA